MSTLKSINVQHPSATTINIVNDSSGNVTVGNNLTVTGNVSGTWSGTTLSVAKGGTSLTTLTANNVLLGNGTSAPQFVAPGTNGNVLTSNGTTWASTAPASSGITLATSVATTSGTSFDFTSIPSTVKRITVIFNGVQMNASGATGFLIQLGTSSGIETSGYVSFGNVIDSSGGSAGISSTAGFVMFSNSTSGLLGGSMTINLLSSNNWVSNHTGQVGDNTRSVTGGGTKSTAATLDRIRLTSTSGTASFTAGSFTIQYE